MLRGIHVNPSCPPDRTPHTRHQMEEDHDSQLSESPVFVQHWDALPATSLHPAISGTTLLIDLNLAAYLSPILDSGQQGDVSVEGRRYERGGGCM